MENLNIFMSQTFSIQHIRFRLRNYNIYVYIDDFTSVIYFPLLYLQIYSEITVGVPATAVVR